ncbi:hypothetical protein [Escherichia phage vB_EcoS_ULIM2]|nr:hypothetical protein [Escherichia phage vB_EcoS_ULIM2]
MSTMLIVGCSGYDIHVYIYSSFIGSYLYGKSD